MRTLFISVVLAFVVSGCSSTNITELINALAGDPATVCATFNAPGGSGTFLRTNIANGELTCNGLTVKSQGSTQIPVTVTVAPPATVTPSK